MGFLNWYFNFNSTLFLNSDVCFFNIKEKVKTSSLI